MPARILPALAFSLFSQWVGLPNFDLQAAIQAVEEREGNIYVQDGGRLEPVTETGHDQSPALSPDRTRLVFVRNLERGHDYSDFARTGAPVRVMQLWVADLASHHAPTLVLDSPVEIRGRSFSAFYDPQFSSDNKYLYFLVQFAATSNAIVRLALATGQLAYVADALEFSVIPKGKYKDDLIARQRHPKLAGGYFEWFYLLDPVGNEIGIIGQGKDDVYAFVDTYIGDPGPCANRSLAEWMVCINQIAPRDQ